MPAKQKRLTPSGKRHSWGKRLKAAFRGFGVGLLAGYPRELMHGWSVATDSKAPWYKRLAGGYVAFMMVAIPLAAVVCAAIASAGIVPLAAGTILATTATGCGALSAGLVAIEGIKGAVESAVNPEANLSLKGDIINARYLKEKHGHQLVHTIEVYADQRGVLLNCEDLDTLLSDLRGLYKAKYPKVPSDTIELLVSNQINTCFQKGISTEKSFLELASDYIKQEAPKGMVTVKDMDIEPELSTPKPRQPHVPLDTEASPATHDTRRLQEKYQQLCSKLDALAELIKQENPAAYDKLPKKHLSSSETSSLTEVSRSRHGSHGR